MKKLILLLIVACIVSVAAADQDFTIQDSNNNPLLDVDGDTGDVRIPEGNLNLEEYNSIEQIDSLSYEVIEVNGAKTETFESASIQNGDVSGADWGTWTGNANALSTPYEGSQGAELRGGNSITSPNLASTELSRHSTAGRVYLQAWLWTFNDNEHGIVELSTDGGSSFQTIRTLDNDQGTNTRSNWNRISVDITPYLPSQGGSGDIRVRFREGGGGGGDQFRIDNVQLIHAPNRGAFNLGFDDDLFYGGGQVGIGTSSPESQLDVSGNTDLRGNVDLNDNRIENLKDPNSDDDAVNKGYADGRYLNDGEIVDGDNISDNTVDNSEIQNSDRFTFNGVNLNGELRASGSSLDLDSDDQGIYIHDGTGNFNIKSGVADGTDNIVAGSGGSEIEINENGRIQLKIDESTSTGNQFSTAAGLTIDNGNVSIQGGFNGCNNNQFVNGNGDCETDDDKPGNNDFGNADDLDNSGSLQTDTVADNEINDNTVDNTEIENSDSFNFQNLRKRVGFSISSGGGTEFFKLGEARGRNFGAKMEVRRSVDQGNSDVSYQEVYISKRGGNANGISELTGTTGQNVEIIITETSNDANSDGYNDAYIYAKCEDYCSSPITLEHSESFTKDFQSGLSSSNIVGNTVFNSMSDLAIRKQSNGNLEIDTIDTGNGNYEIGQNLRTTDSVTFNGITSNSNVNIGDNSLSFSDTSITEQSGNHLLLQGRDPDQQLRLTGDGSLIYEEYHGGGNAFEVDSQSGVDNAAVRLGESGGNVPLDLNNNNINNIGGLQSCGDNQFVDGNGNCQDAGAAKTTARFTSTDTSTDINRNSWTVIPWNLQLDISSGYTHDPSGSPGQITFEESGTYKVHTMLTYDSGNLRINPGIKFSINGNRRDRLGLSGYSRDASGHNEASNYLTEMIDVNAGDTLRVESKRFGNSGTVTLRDRESVLVIQKVSETVPKADDVDKVDGFDAADFVNKAGDTMTGNLNMNSNEITGLSDPTDPQDAATRSWVNNNDDNTQNPINGDLVAGNGLTGGQNNVLPGGNTDVTVSLNADDLDSSGNINDFSAASDLDSAGDIDPSGNINLNGNDLNGVGYVDTNRIDVFDQRDDGFAGSDDPKPNYWGGKMVGTLFSKGLGRTSDWHSGLVVQGWNSDNYETWQIYGPSGGSLSSDADWYLRAGMDNSWNTARKIITDDGAGNVDIGGPTNTGRTVDIGGSSNIDGQLDIYGSSLDMNGGSGGIDNVAELEMDGNISGIGVDFSINELGHITGPNNGDTDLNIQTQGGGSHVVSVEDGSSSNQDIIRFNEGTQLVEIPNGNLNLLDNDLTDVDNIKQDGSSFFQNECSQGNVIGGINSDGSYDCVASNQQVQDNWVNETGDTMTGDLDASGQQITAGGLGLGVSETTASNELTDSVLYADGDIQVSDDIVGAGGGDVAEVVNSTDRLEEGEVAVISGDMKLDESQKAYDKAVAGIISTNPGVVLEDTRNGEKLALTGIVPVKVTMENGQIEHGDMITSSSTPGKAMKCQNMEKCENAIIGKAMEATEKEGKISVLVTLG